MNYRQLLTWSYTSPETGLTKTGMTRIDIAYRLKAKAKPRCMECGELDPVTVEVRDYDDAGHSWLTDACANCHSTDLEPAPTFKGKRRYRVQTHIRLKETA